MANISRVKTWLTGDTLTAADLNAEFDNIHSDYNGGITNANISASAAIDSSKLDSTILTTTNTKTVTNKTLTSPTINNGTITKPTMNGSVQAVSAYTPTASGTATVDLTASNVHVITMPAGNITIAVTNSTVGQFFAIEIVQDSIGSRTVTWFSTIKWVGGVAPTLTTTANKKDTFVFRVVSTGNYDGYVAGSNI